MKLPRPALALAAGAAMLGGVACGVAPGGKSRDDDARQAERGVHLPPRGRLFGFSDQTFTYSADPRSVLNQGVTAERELADARAAGANSARILVSWWNLEPRPGFFDPAYVARLRAFTDPLERAGGRALLQLGSPPPWAAAAPGDPRATIADKPALVRAFARYAGFVAATWQRAAAIETWNEPNTTYFWAPRPEPGLYVRMHRAAAAAIRRAAPKTKLVVGGLLASPASTAQIMAPGTFLRRAYAAGLRPGDYDGLAYHPYPAQAGGRVGSLEAGPFAAGFGDFRSGYRRADPRARIWITETGVSTSGDPNIGEAVPPAEQAAALTRLVRKLLALPEVDALYVHTLYDVVSSPASSKERGYGVLGAAGAAPGRPKPAFCALLALAREPRPFPGCPG